MKLFFLMRGSKHLGEKFINELSTRYLPFKHKLHGGKDLQTGLYQLRVCPVQLYQISFPEEVRDAVLTTVVGKEQGKNAMCPDTKKSWVGAGILFVRKMLGLEKIPEYKTESWLPMDFPEALEIIPIGIKGDSWVGDDGKEYQKKEEAGPNAWEQL